MCAYLGQKTGREDGERRRGEKTEKGKRQEDTREHKCYTSVYESMSHFLLNKRHLIYGTCILSVCRLFQPLFGSYDGRAAGSTMFSISDSSTVMPSIWICSWVSALSPPRWALYPAAMPSSCAYTSATCSQYTASDDVEVFKIVVVLCLWI